MTMSGNARPCMSMHGHAWMKIEEKYKILVKCMAVHGHAWSCMDENLRKK